MYSRAPQLITHGSLMDQGFHLISLASFSKYTRQSIWFSVPSTHHAYNLIDPLAIPVVLKEDDFFRHPISLTVKREKEVSSSSMRQVQAKVIRRTTSGMDQVFSVYSRGVFIFFKKPFFTSGNGSPSDDMLLLLALHTFLLFFPPVLHAFYQFPS